jgi:glycosyltransferase involved in cell wall biosynthesis
MGQIPIISLIVPVWGHDNLAVDLVNRLQIDTNRFDHAAELSEWARPELIEWIVVAVAPTEALCELERCGLIRLVPCREPSRGRQMNLGAAVARGKLLCFHHADSKLEPEHLVALKRIAADDSIIGGAFHRRFYPPRMLWREPIVRWLNRTGGPLFGDQSIFVRKSVFNDLGGFPEIPLMEDVEFSRRLRRKGRIALLDPPLWSPPTRRETWKIFFRNTGLVVLFYLGVTPQRLHRWYYQGRR